MSRKNSAQTAGILPYRDTNNSSVKYAAGATVSETLQPSRTYDSDYEPLIEDPNRTFTGELSEYDMQHFTATGRPAPKFKASALMNLSGGEAMTVPQLLPRRYTDDSIIPAIVTNIIPSPKSPVEVQVEPSGRRRSFFGKLKGGDKEKKLDLNKDGFIKMKVIYMPRREYLKFFARDENGTYIGKEPYKQWSENELEMAFAKYTPKPEAKTGYRAPT